METHMDNKPYSSLLIMVILSFVSMYVFMYAMVDSFRNVYSNFNQFYMAGLMTAPMVLIELGVMRAMYKIKKWNVWVSVFGVCALIVFFLLIRQQVAISDKQFLRSMISHHASAILMCEKASIQDTEIKTLCGGILSSQSEQIDQMKDILGRLEK